MLVLKPVKFKKSLSVGSIFKNDDLVGLKVDDKGNIILENLNHLKKDYILIGYVKWHKLHLSDEAVKAIEEALDVKVDRDWIFLSKNDDGTYRIVNLVRK